MAPTGPSAPLQIALLTVTVLGACLFSACLEFGEKGEVGRSLFTGFLGDAGGLLI